MKKLRILLTCLLLTISFCFTSFAGYNSRRGRYITDTEIDKYSPQSEYWFTPQQYRYCYVVSAVLFTDYPERYYLSSTSGNLPSVGYQLYIGDGGTGTRTQNWYIWLENASQSGTIVLRKNSGSRNGRDPQTVTIHINANASLCTHNWSSWQSDSSQHWKTCSWCGAVTSKGAHTKSGNSCSTCGRVEVPSKEGEYFEKI